ncbi:uncharacterized protein [Henckelia pumila]|uniref:uncharacterized protein n=1 Tax=Henckelia pumila TaxID=405737 RepID=UPI003C6E2E7C
MSMYIQSIEPRAWQCVLDGWSPPMRDDDVPGPKPRSQWTADENTAAIYNAKALNAMFISVDMNMFNLIGTCTYARDAWEKLETHCEGSTSVKKTRMHLITSKFEKMRMEESETIMEYNGRLKSLANEASVLGDPISNERLVSKVLRSVPKRFHTKEVKESDLEENSIALISKKFTDYLKVMKEKKDVKGAQPSKFTKLPTSEKPQKPAATRGSRQRECKGYGHYAYECANRLRKGMNVFLSDDDSEEEQEKVEHADLISFTALLEKQVADPYTLEGIQKLYEELYCDWNKRNQLNTTLAKENTELKAVVARLEVLMSKKDLELGLLNSELERAKTILDKFNSMFVKEGNDSLNHPSTALKGKKLIVEKNVSVPKPKQWKRPFVLPPVLPNTKNNTGKKRPTVKKVWIQKPDVRCLKDHLTDYVKQNGGRVTYGGGAKGRIIGKETLNVEGFPKLHNVLHVEGLNANLISISQLCDDDLHVKFDKNTCEVFDNTNRFVIKDLKRKTAEDDIEGLLEIPHEEHSVVPDVATPNTTLVSPELFMRKIPKILRKLR